MESYNCTIFLQHQTLQLTTVKFDEEEDSRPERVSFTINMVQDNASCEISANSQNKKSRVWF
jgi:hypothetical protein